MKFCPECEQSVSQVLPTHIVVILDMSGSMSHQQAEVIGSFNNFIKEQQKLDTEAYVSLILFDDCIETPYSRVALAETPLLTENVYSPRGMTALYDTINKAVKEHFVAKSNKEKTIFIIITDGAENASHKTLTTAEMKRIISRTREGGGEFVFLATDEASFAQGAAIGIPWGNSISYKNIGYTSGTVCMSNSLTNFRSANITNTSSFFVDDTKKDVVVK